MGKIDNSAFSAEEIARAQSYKAKEYPKNVGPELDGFAHELVAGFADKWTVIILDTLWDEGMLRFSDLARHIGDISQKMLTQTLRRMERDGLVIRKVYACVPPKVEYRLSPLGLSLGAAFCNIWIWAAENHDAVRTARHDFDEKG
ncbi:winged helix-turn-helix transcriptional regulator [Phyllobacterium sp. K27]